MREETAAVTIGVTIDDNFVSTGRVLQDRMRIQSKLSCGRRDAWLAKKSITLRSYCKYLHVLREFIFITQFVVDKSIISLNQLSAS
jgi:hypothetical protein